MSPVFDSMTSSSFNDSSDNFEDEDDVMRGDEDSPRQIIPQATI